jgi:hypothetical protein
MQHPVMGAPETKLQEHLVGVTDEVTVGEKQQLNDVPNGLPRRSTRRTAFCAPRRPQRLYHIYVSHVDIFCFMLQNSIRDERIAPKGLFG